MFGLGIQELIIIVIVILLFVDHKRIPELMRGMGKIYRDLSSARDNIKNELMREDIISVVDENFEKGKATERESIDERAEDGRSGKAG